MQFLDIGYGNLLHAERVISILPFGPASVKAKIDRAKDAQLLINITGKRKSQSVILMDDGSVYISTLKTKTLAAKLLGVRLESTKEEAQTNESEN